jgi:hypothetical protein
MDTEKLFKAIQIVVKEEVKKQLSLIKEEIRKEVLTEIKGGIYKKTSSLKSVVDESEDAFSLANKILSTDREKRQYSKNPLINNVLNETVVRSNFSKDDGEWGTITPEMVGYGDPSIGRQSSVSEPVSTGNDILDKAIARSAAVLAASKDKRR